jgi:putative ABC transport system ATP-binding protein
LLRGVNLAGYAGRDVSNLSGGEAQRVSLARTLANSPEVLLLDEPTSSLDEATRRDAEDLILDIISAQGLTCLVVTHNHGQARRMARQAAVMEAGRLVRFGPIEEVLDA